jgi:hypothetical protein
MQRSTGSLGGGLGFLMVLAVAGPASAGPPHHAGAAHAPCAAMAEAKAAHGARLDTLLATLGGAQGTDAKVAALEAIVTELAAQHKLPCCGAGPEGCAMMNPEAKQP